MSGYSLDLRSFGGFGAVYSLIVPQVHGGHQVGLGSQVKSNAWMSGKQPWSHRSIVNPPSMCSG